MLETHQTEFSHITGLQVVKRWATVLVERRCAAQQRVARDAAARPQNGGHVRCSVLADQIAVFVVGRAPELRR